MNLNRLFDEKIISSSPVGGGDIGRSSRVKTQSGEYFVKYYSVEGTAAAEALGLKAMAGTETIKVPEVIKYDSHNIVLRFISSAPRCPDFQYRLGKGLAEMHSASRTTSCGFEQDNFIGSTVQINSWTESWTEFFINNRLGFQVDLSNDLKLKKIWSELEKKIPTVLSGAEEESCLLHGDLWGGNYISDKDGLPVLIDPAAYYGHREMDLGMTMLFGGFTEVFYRAYDETFPLKAGWRSRMDLYKLYHVLNHMNMFGGGYRMQALSLMKKYL